MRFVDIEVGQEYGLRIRSSAQDPLIRVQILDKVARNKHLRVRHLEEPHVGMEEYFPFRAVQVLWKHRRAFLRNEQQLAEVRELSAGIDFPLIDAVQFVLDTSAERSFFVHSDGHFSAHKEPLLRVSARANLGQDLSAIDPHAFVDRDGWVQMTYHGAERLAKAFASTEPDTVTMAVAAYEDEYRAKGYDIGERFWHDHLQKQRPMLALARQWAGFDTEIKRLAREVERLRNLLSMAVSDLERAGAITESRRLTRAMDGL